MGGCSDAASSSCRFPGLTVKAQGCLLRREPHCLGSVCELQPKGRQGPRPGFGVTDLVSAVIPHTSTAFDAAPLTLGELRQPRPRMQGEHCSWRRGRCIGEQQLEAWGGVQGGGTQCGRRNIPLRLESKPARAGQCGAAYGRCHGSPRAWRGGWAFQSQRLLRVTTPEMPGQTRAQCPVTRLLPAKGQAGTVAVGQTEAWGGSLV